MRGALWGRTPGLPQGRPGAPQALPPGRPSSCGPFLGNGPDGRRAPLAKSASAHAVASDARPRLRFPHSQFSLFSGSASVQCSFIRARPRSRFPHLQFSLFPFSAFRARTGVFSPVTPSRPRPAENFFYFPPAGAYPPRGKQPPCDVGSPPGTKSWEDLCMSLHIPGTTPRA